MIWQYILTGLSCTLFFGFVALCVWKFGLQSCYSAYGEKWRDAFPPLNIWSAVTFTTAVLLVPTILEASKDNPWQAVAFFCPALLIFVAATPYYAEDSFVHILHGACAVLSAGFALTFIFIMASQLWALVAVVLILTTLLMIVCGTYSAMFWYEMAAYVSVYIAVFSMI